MIENSLSQNRSFIMGLRWTQASGTGSWNVFGELVYSFKLSQGAKSCRLPSLTSWTGSRQRVISLISTWDKQYQGGRMWHIWAGVIDNSAWSDVNFVSLVHGLFAICALPSHRNSFETFMLKMQYHQMMTDLKKMPQELSGALSKCKELTKENQMYWWVTTMVMTQVFRTACVCPSLSLNQSESSGYIYCIPLKRNPASFKARL